MDENKKDLLNDDSSNQLNDEAKKEDSGFEIESVASEDALSDIISGLDKDSDEDDGFDEEKDIEESAEDILLAKYAADCDRCATKVYFELEDLDEDGNLLCPNCEETIEIDNDAIDYYLVNKPDENESEGQYVVDCPACEAIVHFTIDDIDEDEEIECPQCSEKIHIDTEVLDAYKEKDIEKSLKRKAKLKKALAIVCGVVLGLVAACAVLWFVGNKQVVKVDGTSVPMNIYSCVYYCENAMNYSSYGYNMEKKASAQPYTEDDEDGNKYDTWDDFLKESTEKSLKLYYSIYNAGQKEGYKINEDDKKQVDDTIDSLKSSAEESNLSFEDYMKTNYGIKIKEKDFRPYLELSAYVNSYYKHVMGKDVTKDQLEKIYSENPDNFDVVSFRYFYIGIDDSVSKEEALKRVKAVAAAKSEAEFHKLAKKYATEEMAKNYKEDDSTLIKDMACSNIVDRPVTDMLTDSKSKKGQTGYGVSADGTYAEAAMVVTPRHKDDKLIRDQAISEVASKKGEKYLDEVSKDTVVNAGVGIIIRNILF